MISFSVAEGRTLSPGNVAHRSPIWAREILAIAISHTPMIANGVRSTVAKIGGLG